MPRPGTLVLLVCLWTLLFPAVNAQPPGARLSVGEAHELVDAALYPNETKAVLEQIHNPYEPDFIFFEAIDPNPNHSAHMGTFAVNPWTGDVWSTAGFEMLKSIQARSKLDTAEFDRRRAKKPICDAD